MRYIAFLRGINIGGHIVKMDRLRALFVELGFAQVSTYIQSGNVFFETAQTDREALAQAIEQHLREALNYDVPVCLLTLDELEQLLALDPFKEVPVTPDTRLCLVLTARPIPDGLTLPLFSPKRDVQIVSTTARAAFVVWYIINGKPPTADSFLEKTLGSKTTSRFFHTAAKILEAAKPQRS